MLDGLVAECSVDYLLFGFVFGINFYHLVVGSACEDGCHVETIIIYLVSSLHLIGR